MPRKNLKQKLKSQLRNANRERDEAVTTQHELAGITINYELTVTQSVAMAHGVMASLTTLKKILSESGVDVEVDPAFLEFQKISQARIAQCVVKLHSCNLSGEELNNRIIRGY